MKVLHPIAALAAALLAVSCTDSSTGPAALEAGLNESVSGTSSLSVLVDASRDGGAWWFPQASGFDPNAPHQGKAFADYLRSFGATVAELPRYSVPFGAVITPDLLHGYDLVVRANEFGNYAATELEAYRHYVRNGGTLLLLHDFIRPPRVDHLGPVFGIQFAGETKGPQLMNFVPNPLTGGVANGQLLFLAGSGLLKAPGTVLARLDESSWLDLDDDGVQDPGEPTAPAVMGTTRFGKGRLVYLGDTNVLLGVPQPLVDNIICLTLGIQTPSCQPG